MKEKKSKRVIVRITESQFNNLMECVIDEQIKISDILRESIIDKLQKLKKDDKRKKSFSNSILGGLLDPQLIRYWL